jgi:hypothetical protein
MKNIKRNNTKRKKYTKSKIRQRTMKKGGIRTSNTSTALNQTESSTNRRINIMEGTNGIDIDSVKDKIRLIEFIDYIYIALGSAVHENNDFSKYQTIPNFLDKDKKVLVILYDDFTSETSNENLEKCIKKRPNWVFLIVNRDRTNENNSNINGIKNNLRKFLITVIECIHEKHIDNWLISNYIAFRDPGRIEIGILNGTISVFNEFKTGNEEHLFTWNYDNTNIIKNISNNQIKKNIK